MTVIISILASIIFGIKDVVNKLTTKNNSIINILTAKLLIGVLVATTITKNYELDPKVILIVVVKSTLILIAWILALEAIKNLPISIITPFNVIRPIAVTVLSFLIYKQTLTPNQLFGFIVLTIAYFGFSRVAKKEKIDILKNKYFYYFLVASACNVSSALIDKYLLVDMDEVTLQFYFYLFMFIGYAIINIKGKEYKTFKFDWFILIMALAAFGGDFLYFKAIKAGDVNIGIVSMIKRFSIVVSAMLGGIVFKEHNLKHKLGYTLVILIGMALIVIS